MRCRLLPFLAVLVVACSADDPLQPENLVGFYTVNTLDGVPLPAPLPCGGGSLQYSMLHLDTDGRAALNRIFDMTHSGPIVVEAQGTYSRFADGIIVELEGGSPGQPPSQMTIVLTVDAQELHEVFGRPCDAHAVAVYLPALVTLD